jgi:hypothetical protein
MPLRLGSSLQYWCSTVAFGVKGISRNGLGMGAIERDPGMGKLQKTAKELEGMLRSALQERHGAVIEDLNIRVFRTKADLPEWNAEILGGERVVEDDVKDTFERVSLDLQRQFGLAD